ncbi:hypothetical protein SDC9_81919 [bioreactor metagenome]|uniref:Uncharacterized protein n=1 Tax=bioreactor metagenome TaxID=1076179 RepID=A0A644Z439_9ZZZZ
MCDASAETGFRGILLIDVSGVEIARDPREQIYVCLTDGLADAGGLADSKPVHGEPLHKSLLSWDFIGNNGYNTNFYLESRQRLLSKLAEGEQQKCLHFCKISIERLFSVACRRPPQNAAAFIGRFYLTMIMKTV